MNGDDVDEDRVAVVADRPPAAKRRRRAASDPAGQRSLARAERRAHELSIKNEFIGYSPAYWARRHYLQDTAKYHHHRGEDWASPSKMNKTALATYLRRCEVKSITLDDNRVITDDKYSADANKRAGGPTLVQLRAVVKRYVETNNMNTTVPHQLMNDAHHTLLYTPPYVSDLQPIELIWAFTKKIVAHQSHRTRSATVCAEQTLLAMKDVGQSLCEKVIEHTHAWMVQFMHGDHGGTLAQFDDLADVVDGAMVEDEVGAEAIDE